MAVLTRSLEDWRDIFGECHRLGLCPLFRILAGCSRTWGQRQRTGERERERYPRAIDAEERCADHRDLPVSWMRRTVHSHPQQTILRPSFSLVNAPSLQIVEKAS